MAEIGTLLRCFTGHPVTRVRIPDFPHCCCMPPCKIMGAAQQPFTRSRSRRLTAQVASLSSSKCRVQLPPGTPVFQLSSSMAEPSADYRLIGVRFPGQLPISSGCKSAVRQRPSDGRSRRFESCHPDQLQRDMAQPGSALLSGRRGRRFKSCYPDQLYSPARGDGFPPHGTADAGRTAFSGCGAAW